MNPEQYLDDRYDHVQKFDKQKMDHGQIARIEGHSLNTKACVNRNLHNGETKNMIIKAKITDGPHIYLAGDEVEQ